MPYCNYEEILAGLAQAPKESFRYCKKFYNFHFGQCYGIDFAPAWGPLVEKLELTEADKKIMKERNTHPKNAYETVLQLVAQMALSIPEEERKAFDLDLKGVSKVIARHKMGRRCTVNDIQYAHILPASWNEANNRSIYKGEKPLYLRSFKPHVTGPKGKI